MTTTRSFAIPFTLYRYQSAHRTLVAQQAAEPPTISSTRQPVPISTSHAATQHVVHLHTIASTIDTRYQVHSSRVSFGRVEPWQVVSYTWRTEWCTDGVSYPPSRVHLGSAVKKYSVEKGSLRLIVKKIGNWV